MSLDDRIIREDSPAREIETLQRMLIRANPSLLTQYEVDGVYGSETDEAVRDYQAFAGVTQDGIAGPVTLNGLRDLVTIRSSFTNTRAIEILQEDLMYFYIELPRFGADGDYGNETTAGVERFQSHNDLTVDGIAGPNTLRTMDEERETILLDYGARGSAVRRVQEQLNEQESVEISLEVGGFYGSITQAAVEDFQRANDLHADGIAGPRTMRLLDTEAIQLMSDEELEGALEEIDIRTNELNDSQQQTLLNVLISNNAYQEKNVFGEIEEVLGTQLDYQGVMFNVLYLEYANTPNITSVAFFSAENELMQFSIIDVFGNLYTDEITVSHFDVEGKEIDSVTQTNLDVEDQELAFLTAFQKAYEEVNAVQNRFSTNAVQNRSSTDDVVAALACGTLASVGGHLGSKALFAAGFFIGPAGWMGVLVAGTIGAALGLAFCI